MLKTAIWKTHNIPIQHQNLVVAKKGKMSDHVPIRHYLGQGGTTVHLVYRGPSGYAVTDDQGQEWVCISSDDLQLDAPHNPMMTVCINDDVWLPFSPNMTINELKLLYMSVQVSTMYTLPSEFTFAYSPHRLRLHQSEETDHTRVCRYTVMSTHRPTAFEQVLPRGAINYKDSYAGRQEREIHS
jgi:hypothetical protein